MPEPSTAEKIASISAWIDGSPAYANLDAEAHAWRRTMKPAEEVGEVYQAMSASVGANPRKATEGGTSEVIEELLDVAIAALGAIEFHTGNMAMSLAMLDAKATRTWRRVGLHA